MCAVRSRWRAPPTRTAPTASSSSCSRRQTLARRQIHDLGDGGVRHGQCRQDQKGRCRPQRLGHQPRQDSSRCRSPPTPRRNRKRASSPPSCRWQPLTLPPSAGLPPPASAGRGAPAASRSVNGRDRGGSPPRGLPRAAADRHPADGVRERLPLALTGATLSLRLADIGVSLTAIGLFTPRPTSPTAANSCGRR